MTCAKYLKFERVMKARDKGRVAGPIDHSSKLIREPGGV